MFSMYHIAIIGVGRVGATLAYDLLLSEYFDTIDLVDMIPKLPQALQEDLYHVASLMGINAEIHAYNDASHIEDADIIVITAGKARTKESSRRDLATINFRIMNDILQSIVGKNEGALYFVISNPVDALSTFVSDIVGDKVFGTGTILETARLKSYISRSLRIKPNDIHGWVGGEHGESAVVLWSTIRIKGKDLNRYLTDNNLKLDLTDAEQYVKNISKKIIEGQGATIWGPAKAFSELIVNVIKNTGQIMSFTYPTELPGLKKRVHVSIPRETSIKPKYDLWEHLTEEEKRGIIHAAKEILETYRIGLKNIKK